MAGDVNREGNGNPEQVRPELEAILASEVFVHSARLSGFLRYVVEESLAGRAGTLKEYQIGVDVFRRPESFDPKTDPVVRVEARQLRFKLSQYYEGAGREDTLVISVPKGGYAPRFEHLDRGVVPVPPAVPAPEVAPDVTPLAVAVPETAPEAGPVSRKLLAAGLAAAMLCLAGVAGLKWRGTTAPQQPSLVVLPFVNLDGDPSNDYLASGLTDGITGALARVRALRVIAGASASEMRASRGDVRKVGRELNVATVLDGDISRQKETIRIAVRLLQTADASVLLTRTWEGPAGQVYAAQAELASAVTAALRAPGVAFRPVTPDARAQDYFLRARYEADQLTRASLKDAIAHYEQALELDPHYAAAWYGLAVARHRWPVYAADGSALDRRAVEQAYQHAIEADPNFPEPHTGLALIAMQQDWDWDRAEQELAAANAIAPSAIAESHAAYLKLLRGRRAEMDQHIRRARDLDPLGPAILMNTAEIQMLAGEFAAARQVLERFSAAHPDVPTAKALMAYTYLAEGKPEEALRRFQALDGQFPGAAVFAAMAQARTGRRTEALRLVTLPEDSAERSGATLYSMAQAYGYLGDEVHALDWLRRSADARESLAPNASLDPAFEAMRERPAFQLFLRRLHL